MKKKLVCAFVLALVFALPLSAHEGGHAHHIVIDTDMGLDDIVTLSLALQSPEADVLSVVACEGVAGREKAVEFIERLLWFCNRGDVVAYSPANHGRELAPPVFRATAEGFVDSVLAKGDRTKARSFSPEAYTSKKGKTIVLILGPLTNLAEAIKQKPEIIDGIERVIVSGAGDPEHSWNGRFDPHALAAIKASGLPLTFVKSGDGGKKPDEWVASGKVVDQALLKGQLVLQALFANERVRNHYTGQFGSFHDELAWLYLIDPSLFSKTAEGPVVEPSNRYTIAHLFMKQLNQGRHVKHRVVFADRPFPPSAFRLDVQEKRASIIEKNGTTEWFAQLMLNEMHDHLGAYSVIGVKMGLRACELLNAPRDAIIVNSRTAPHPPHSCLNDGVIVATGSTPGRGLFRHEAGPAGSVEVLFTYNGKTLKMDLKSQYREKLSSRIKSFIAKSKAGQADYWPEVRKLGLDIWENWHREDLFLIEWVD